MTPMLAEGQESLRQSALLAAIWQLAPDGLAAADGIVAPHGSGHPWRPYTRHAQAISAQVLAAAYPTIEGMIGGEAVAVLAWRLWQSHPPLRADLNRWGQALPGLIRASEELAAWPHLADAARLDWAFHDATQALDADPDLDTLQRLGDTPPELLMIRLRPDVRVVESVWPIVTLRQAQLEGGPHACALIDEALRGAQPETAVVWREGWQARAVTVPASMTGWMLALAADQAATEDPADLLSLMAAQPDDFDFTTWLTLALQQGWLWRIDVRNPSA